MLINFCSRIIEACWLIAIAGIPLFFNPYTSRVFEADKTYFMRSITLIMLVAWIVKTIVEPKSIHLSADESDKNNAGTYIFILVGSLAIIYLISSVFSITPYFSFKGYFLREEGFYTFICYLLIFFILLKNINRKNQLDRLINVIILTATIVSIYGILQSFKIDTVSWAIGDRSRVATTLGNPIFACAFLIMVIPIIISRLIQYINKGFNRNYTAIIAYTIILIINILCIILTKSRGPFIGFVISLFLFVLLVARIKQIRWLFRSVIAVTLLSIIFLAVLNIPRGPFHGIKKHLGRFAELYEMDKGSVKVRLLIWEGAVSIIKSSPARLFFGHGLESPFPLYHKYVPSSFARFEGNSIPDHSHNETFDMLITSGVLGLFVYLAIIFMVIYYILKYIGLLPSFSSKRLFILMMLGGVVVGALVPLLLHKALFLGLTIPFGFLAGFIFYLVMTWKTENISFPPEADPRLTVGQVSQAQGSKKKTASEKGDNVFLLVGLICALLAHFSELQFGIGVTSTRLYFWVYMAIILFILKAGSYAQETTNLPSEAAEGIKSIRTNLINQSVVYGLIIGLIIAFFSFELLKRRFIQEGIPSAFYYIIFAVGLFSVLFIIFILKNKSLSLTETNQKGSPGVALPGILILSISILWGGIFYYILISLLGDFTKPNTIFINFCYIFIGLTLIMLIGFIHKCDLYDKESENIKGNSLRIGTLVGILLLSLSIAVIYYTNLRETYADIFCQEGADYEKSQKWQESINSYKKSIELSPQTDYYYASLGRVYKSNNDYPDAIETLRNALKINPLNPFHHIDIARFYKEWAETFKDKPVERDSKLLLSLEEYQRLSVLTPKNPLVSKEMGDIYFIQNNYEKSIEQYLYALNLDDQLPEVYLSLGKVYHQIDQPDKVIEVYQKAYRLNEKTTRYEFVKLGETYFNQNRFEDSLKVNLALIDLSPKDYQHYHNAAVVLDRLGRIDEAIEYSRKAIDLIQVPVQKEGPRKFLKKLEEKKNK
ncbi:MAG: tetratricopeptide repeat protein [Planctomycetota bacterium]